MELNQKESSFSILSNDNTTFILFRDTQFNQSDINISPKDKKEFLTLVFDFDNLVKEIDNDKTNSYTLKDIINNNIESYDKDHLNIVIKNSVIGKETNLYDDNKDLNLKKLYISDELYSMSPNMHILFQKFKPRELILKKCKINSKLQLNNFLNFILNTGCEVLFLEDIFIELLIKKDEKDEEYNDLEQYITFENGKFYICKNDEKKETKIKKLKMIDCSLFALSEDTFKNINNYKDISLDIEQNSLLNANIITKFKINNGYSDICFDLDSYMISEEEENEEKEKDYIDGLNYIFNIIFDNKDNHNFEKIQFKNFDMTKYEYITGENLTFIDEKNRVLFGEEKEKKEKFEKNDEELNKKINDNLDKLSNLKGLIFNNCSSHFMNLIFKFINNSKNDLDYLKIKSCGKEYFDLRNILSLNVKNLLLFDTPLMVDNFPSNDNLGKIENLSIRLCSLEHYCKVNNLNYYKSLEIFVELITNEKLNQNLCLEMNALPIIMTFLVSREYNKNKNLKESQKWTIPQFFEFIPDFEEKEDPKRKAEKIKRGIQERDSLVNIAFRLNGLQNKTITLKKNNIKNRLENFEFYYLAAVNFERGKFLKIDFGKDIFNLDLDFRSFFLLNNINNIIFENCLFSSYTSMKLRPEQISETIINLIRETKKNYKFDMKTINEIFFRNKNAEDIRYFLKYLTLENGQIITTDIIEYLKNLGMIFNNIKYLFGRFHGYINETTIIFNDIKDKKQFYCLLAILGVLLKDKNNTPLKFVYHEKEMEFKLPSQGEIRKKLENYFIIKKDENNKDMLSPTFNYYYTGPEEKELFGDFENRKSKIIFEQLKFNIEYKFNDQWDFIMK